MFDSFPLARYFTRIGYHGPAEPTLEVLRQLHLLHPQAIPFENIDAYSGLGVSLDLARIADKMLARGRGGYCFEHNRLFQAVLEQLGFRVTPLIARVRWQVPADVRTGLTHMLLRVDLDGRSWLVDVAFGSTTQTAPLEFLLNVPQETPHGVFRIAPVGRMNSAWNSRPPRAGARSISTVCGRRRPSTSRSATGTRPAIRNRCSCPT